MVENHNHNSFSEAVVGGNDGLKMKIMIATEVSWERNTHKVPFSQSRDSDSAALTITIYNWKP